MSEELQKEIMAAVEKSLPAQIGNALKARLERAERVEIALASAQADLDRVVTQKADLSAKLETLKAQRKKEDELEKRERELNEADKLLNMKLQHTEERIKDMKQMCQLVFGNNMIKRNIFGSRDIWTKDGYSQSLGHSETIETEE